MPLKSGLLTPYETTITSLADGRFVLAGEALMYASTRVTAQAIDLQSVSWFASPAVSNGHFVVEFHGHPGQQYQLETSSDLKNWQELRTIILTNRVNTLSDLSRHRPSEVLPCHPSAMNKTLLLPLACVLVLAFQMEAHAQPTRIACIGDSITQGSGVDNPTVNAYPVVLGRLLGTNYQTRNFGVSGRTLLRKGDYPYWRETAFRDATNYAPDIVTIKLGTNDSKPQNWRYKSEFATDLADMIEVFAPCRASSNLVCLPLPAYGSLRY